MPTTGYFAGRTIDELARDLRERRATATDLVRHALDAIAALDPPLNAFVSVDAEGAQAAARQADRELADGVDRGPLHGVPVAVKDLVMVAGMPATMGSRHFAGYLPAEDAACVALLRQAGAIVVGKTTTHEFAYGPTGDRSANGPSRNPWDPARMSGGSSGGSAVAVAAGMVPLAIGTDTGGSVRIPAALCGVAGFKPAYGAISADGVFPLSRTLDHVGVLAATEQDCLTAYHALTSAPGTTRTAVDTGTRLSSTPRTASGTGAPLPGDPRTITGSGEPASGAPRVAWLAPEDLFATDPRVAAAARAALEAGVGPLDELHLSAADVAEFRETYVAIQSSETAAIHATRLAEAPELFDPEVLARLKAATGMPGWRYVRALEARARLAEAVAALFGRHEVLALPTVPLTAPPLDSRETDLDDRPVAVGAALLSLTSPWNVLGLPALTVPAGLVDGLPVALQLVCRPGHEHLLFEAAGARRR
jgi:aspartyl-tRNA(Asn)/glutamyl-tRNA(Gln) amidotransferase subunit A